MDGISVILITTPSKEIARQIAGRLLERQLIACANILPGIQSLYTWKGSIQEDEETLMFCKTRSACFESLCRIVQEMHPYELPEIITLPVGQGLPAYLAWVSEATQAD